MEQRRHASIIVRGEATFCLWTAEISLLVTCGALRNDCNKSWIRENTIPVQSRKLRYSISACKHFTRVGTTQGFRYPCQTRWTGPFQFRCSPRLVIVCGVSHEPGASNGVQCPVSKRKAETLLILGFRYSIHAAWNTSRTFHEPSRRIILRSDRLVKDASLTGAENLVRPLHKMTRLYAISSRLGPVGWFSETRPATATWSLVLKLGKKDS